MIHDLRTTFATAASVISAAGTVVLGNYIDRNFSPNFDQGPLFLVIYCNSSIITGGVAGTFQLQLISSASTNGASPNIHLSTPIWVTGATSVAPLNPSTNGQPMFISQLPKGSGIVGLGTYLRYIMVQAIIGTTATTGGSVTAFLTLQTGGWAALPEAVQ